MESYIELGLLPPDLYPERAQLAAEELDQDLYAAAYGEPEPAQENSVYNFFGCNRGLMKLFGGFISAYRRTNTKYGTHIEYPIAATTIFSPSAARAKAFLMEDCLVQYPLEQGYINHMAGVAEVTQEQLEAYLESNAIYQR